MIIIRWPPAPAAWTAPAVPSLAKYTIVYYSILYYTIAIVYYSIGLVHYDISNTRW